jgi:hypothetical protein
MFATQSGFVVGVLRRETLLELKGLLLQYAQRDHMGIQWTGDATQCKELVGALLRLGLDSETDVKLTIVPTPYVDERTFAALAAVLGYRIHPWNQVEQRIPPADHNVCELIPRIKVASKVACPSGTDILIGNFELAAGFAVALDERRFLFSSAASLERPGFKKGIAARKKLKVIPAKTDKVIEFCATLMVKRLATELAHRIQLHLLDPPRSLLFRGQQSQQSQGRGLKEQQWQGKGVSGAQAHWSDDGISIEHVAALSGKLVTLNQRALSHLREMLQKMIDENPEALRQEIADRLAKVLPHREGGRDAGQLEREIQAFSRDYVELLRLKLTAVPHLSDGRRPSQVVPKTSIEQDAWEHILVSFPSQARRCRHVLEMDEKERDIATRTIGSVPLAFDCVCTLVCLPFIWWIVWASVIMNLVWPVTVMGLEALGLEAWGEGGGCVSYISTWTTKRPTCPGEEGAFYALVGAWYLWVGYLLICCSWVSYCLAKSLFSYDMHVSSSSYDMHVSSSSYDR